MKSPLQEYLDFAVETVYQAGRITLGYFRSGTSVDLKGDNSPVTAADREAEALIRSRIEAKYPQHAIVGEEFGDSRPAGADHCWYVDPIDGTKSFIRGVPLYAVLLGLEIEAKIEAGVAYFPALDEMVYAASGSGCFWNGRRARVSSERQLSRSFVSFTDPMGFENYGRQAAWERIQAATYYRVGWSDAYGHALVATGRLELMLDPVMNSWDCGPFPVLLREAGGFFGDWSGNETISAGEALSTTQALLPDVLGLIEGRNRF